MKLPKAKKAANKLFLPSRLREGSGVGMSTLVLELQARPSATSRLLPSRLREG